MSRYLKPFAWCGWEAFVLILRSLRPLYERYCAFFGNAGALLCPKAPGSLKIIYHLEDRVVHFSCALRHPEHVQELAYQILLTPCRRTIAAYACQPVDFFPSIAILTPKGGSPYGSFA